VGGHSGGWPFGCLFAHGIADSYASIAHLAAAHEVPLPWLVPSGIDGGLVSAVLRDMMLLDTEKRRLRAQFRFRHQYGDEWARHIPDDLAWVSRAPSRLLLVIVQMPSRASDSLATFAVLGDWVCWVQLNRLGKVPRPRQLPMVSVESEGQINEIRRMPVYCSVLVCGCYESKALSFQLGVARVFNPFGSLP
jgi:hypothetical protein